MFCQTCGTSVRERFCGHCGARCQEIAATSNTDDSLSLADVVDGWRYESRLEELLRWPEVRLAIEAAGNKAMKRLTGEQFLAIADKLVPQAVPMEGVAVLAQALFTRLGVQTNQRRESLVPVPVGEVTMRTLCSLAERSQRISTISQAADGCVIEAAQPSDLWSLAGTLVITIRRHNVATSRDATEVTALATVPGQLFDWGKNHRCLDTLFNDLRQPIQLIQRAA